MGTITALTESELLPTNRQLTRLVDQINNGAIDGLTVKSNSTDQISLGGRGQGLRLTFWDSALGNPVITVDGFDQHLAGRAADAEIISALAPLVDPETLIELAVPSTMVFNHILRNYPLPWRYLSDEYDQHHPYGANFADWVDYFDADSKEARSLRCYRDSAQLWSDAGCSIDILRQLIARTDLYLAHPLAELPRWFAFRDRPGGSGGDFSRYAN